MTLWHPSMIWVNWTKEEIEMSKLGNIKRIAELEEQLKEAKLRIAELEKMLNVLESDGAPEYEDEDEE